MKSVLIAEDDKFLASAYKVKLSKQNLGVTVVSDGVEAMNFLQENIPDLVILDLVMPKKDGFTVLKEMKADEKLKGIPVVVASNLGQKEDIDKARQFGADDYIVKTDLSMKELIQKINHLIAS